MVPGIGIDAEDAAEKFADDDGGLDVACLKRGEGVEGAVDLGDGLREEVDGSEAEGGPEGGDEDDGFGGEHIERSLYAFSKDFQQLFSMLLFCCICFLSLFTHSFRFRGQDNGSPSLRKTYNEKREESSGPYGFNVSNPTP